MFEIAQGFEAQLRQVARRARDGDDRLLVIGYPIPSEVGGANVQFHWQPVWLPPVSWKDEHADGFRTNELGYWLRDRQKIFFKSHKISWERAENWNALQAKTRGMFSSEVNGENMLLIGCGALGSVIAEILVRGGLQRLVIFDSDTLSHVNLCRHVLDLTSLGKEKSVALAQRLNHSNPHATVLGFEHKFPSSDSYHKGISNPCRVVIECTGADNTLVDLGKPIWDQDRLFISISLSYGAKRLYCFSSMGRVFPLEEFNAAIRPWLLKDVNERGNEELPPEGIGCWHPAFPARIDEVWTFGGIAASFIERVVQNTPSSPALVVYERGSGDDVGTIRRVTL